MKLTQEIDQIQEAMLHTKKMVVLTGRIDEVVVQLAGTFAADRFIVIKKTKDPVFLQNHILTLIMKRKSLPKMVERSI